MAFLSDSVLPYGESSAVTLLGREDTIPYPKNRIRQANSARRNNFMPFQANVFERGPVRWVRLDEMKNV